MSILIAPDFLYLLTQNSPNELFLNQSNVQAAVFTSREAPKQTETFTFKIQMFLISLFIPGFCEARGAQGAVVGYS